jgi:hypothetical protein
MRRQVVGWLALLVMLGLLGPTGSSAHEVEGVLGPSRTRVELPLGPPPADNAILQVAVSAVRNPEKVPVSVLVTLQDAERRSPRVDVFRFALFPPDAPGRFIGRADSALELIAGRIGTRPTRLILGVEFDPAAGAASDRTAVELQVSGGWTAVPAQQR